MEIEIDSNAINFGQWFGFIVGIIGVYVSDISIVIMAYIFMFVITALGLRYGEERLETFKKQETKTI